MPQSTLPKPTKLNQNVTVNIADNLSGFNDAYRGYIEAIYFTDTGDIEEPASDIEMAHISQLKCMQAVGEFLMQVETAGLLGNYIEQPGTSYHQLGVDFWLTSQGHGAGFWDRGLGALGEELTRIAEHCGSVDTYEGDDGLLYL